MRGQRALVGKRLKFPRAPFVASTTAPPYKTPYKGSDEASMLSADSPDTAQKKKVIGQSGAYSPKTQIQKSITEPKVLLGHGIVQNKDMALYNIGGRDPAEYNARQNIDLNSGMWLQETQMAGFGIRTTKNRNANHMKVASDIDMTGTVGGDSGPGSGLKADPSKPASNRALLAVKNQKNPSTRKKRTTTPLVSPGRKGPGDLGLGRPRNKPPLAYGLVEPKRQKMMGWDDE
jgi:hypothetical protein